MPEIDDVVPGEIVESVWGNQIRDRTLQRYVDEVERDFLNPTPTAGDLAWLDNVESVQVFNGEDWVGLGGAGSTQVKVKLSPQSDVVGELVDDDDLFFDVEADETWAFQFLLMPSNNSSGAHLELGFPAVVEDTRWFAGVAGDPADSDILRNTPRVDSATGFVEISESTGGVIISGAMTNGPVPGTVQLKWRNNDSGAFSSMNSHSSLIATQA